MFGKKAHSIVVPNNTGSRNIFSNRHMILKILTIACLGIASLLYSITIVSHGSERPATTERNEAMYVTKQNSVMNQGIPPIDLSVPARIETATFALGWFWGPDSRFGSIKGVIRTRVGYTGGKKKNPTYHSLGDHSESIQIDYDPSMIS
jgi:hypothetical protein